VLEPHPTTIIGDKAYEVCTPNNNPSAIRIVSHSPIDAIISAILGILLSRKIIEFSKTQNAYC